MALAPRTSADVVAIAPAEEAVDLEGDSTSKSSQISKGSKVGYLTAEGLSRKMPMRIMPLSKTPRSDYTVNRQTQEEPASDEGLVCKSVRGCNFA